MRLAAIVTSADPQKWHELLDLCRAAVGDGTSVRLFFRDESIPAICRPQVQARLGSPDVPDLAASLAELKAAGDVRLHACSSSLYIWGVAATDLIEPLDGARGLIAFLAEDIAEADQVLSF